MKIDKDEEVIINALNSIYTKESNIKYNVNRKLNKKKEIFIFKKVAVTFSVLLSLVVAVPVMAGTFPSFELLLNTIDSKFENLLQPIQLISENNGIKMEVVSAMKDEDMIVMYITLQDIEGDRIDETLDLNDSYKVKGLNVYTSEVIDYNEKNKTATIRIQANSNENLNNKKIEFSLDSFISGEKNISSSVSNDIFADNLINEVKNTVKLDMDNIPGGGGELYKELRDQKEVDILEKDKLNIEFNNISCMNITNIGIISNQLHIQTKWDKSKFDNHGFLYLTDNEGKKIDVRNASISYSFDEYGKSIYGDDYVEYIFDLENINLKNININANVFYSEIFVEGPWKTNFEIESISEEKVVNQENINSYYAIDKIKISKLGVSIIADDNLDEISSIKINMNNGMQEILDSKIIIGDENETSIKFLSTEPIDIQSVKSIEINEEKILLQ